MSNFEAIELQTPRVINETIVQPINEWVDQTYGVGSRQPFILPEDAEFISSGHGLDPNGRQWHSHIGMAPLPDGELMHFPFIHAGIENKDGSHSVIQELQITPNTVLGGLLYIVSYHNPAARLGYPGKHTETAFWVTQGGMFNGFEATTASTKHIRRGIYESPTVAVPTDTGRTKSYDVDTEFFPGSEPAALQKLLDLDAELATILGSIDPIQKARVAVVDEDYIERTVDPNEIDHERLKLEQKYTRDFNDTENI